MPNIKIKSCPYAVIISASFWLKQQESVQLWNTHTHPFKSLSRIPSVSTLWGTDHERRGGSSPGCGSGSCSWYWKDTPGAQAPARIVLATAISTCRLHSRHIKQPFEHICSRDSVLKITVPWQVCRSKTNGCIFMDHPWMTPCYSNFLF